MKVCLIVVTYNRFNVLTESIAYIEAQERPVDYFVVVDNGSTDGTAEHLKDKHKDIEVLPLNSNLGYGAGLSFGLKHALKTYAAADFFWLMDDDSRPDPGLLASLINSRKAIGTPSLLSSLGFIDNVWKGPVRITNYRSKKPFRDTGLPLYPVDHVLIDGALVDREIVERVGTPREDLFMMCEDVEYSQRIRRAGFGIFCLLDQQSITRLHLGGGMRFSKATLWRGYYHARNHLVILKDYFSFKAMIGYAIRQTKFLILALAAPDRFKRIQLRLLGIYHGINGKMGKTIDPSRFQ